MLLPKGDIFEKLQFIDGEDSNNLTSMFFLDNDYALWPELLPTFSCSLLSIVVRIVWRNYKPTNL